MSSRPAATAVSTAGRLRASTVPVAALRRRDRDAAYDVFAQLYDGTCRTRFERDLDDKQLVIVLRDGSDGALRGFSTIGLSRRLTPVGDATVLFSGDTVVDRAYWGQKALQREFVSNLLRLKLTRPARPLLWFLVSKGYRTYLLMANSCRRSIPAHQPASPALRATLDQLAVERFAERYDAVAGVVRNVGGRHERVRRGVAPVPEGLPKRNRHVAAFLARNPGHQDGDELACLAVIGLDDLVRSAGRSAAATV
ncbi:MAG: hypothetical protein M3P48_01145, partial [Actinomycetota bacterium]|nr:hypothetical protein [Actinomycetota bacterium]